jgi:hypothetical protein
MAIIMKIRKFLRLDKTVLELDNAIVDSAGLIILEKKDFMQVQQQCFVYKSDASLVKHELVGAGHLPIDLHSSQLLHF